MKRTTLLCMVCVLAIGGFGSFSAFAHDGKHPDAPNPSPMASVSQEVGYTEVSVKYGSPGVKDRTVWGDLVPYNGGDPRPWAAGANGSTILTIAEDVKVNGKELAAGSYGLHMIPTKDEWIIIISTDSGRFGIMSYTQDKDALRVTAKPKDAPYQEWLTYEIVKTGELTADLNLRWENISVGFTIEAPDHRKMKE